MDFFLKDVYKRKVGFSFYIDPVVKKELIEVCEAEDIGMSEFIRDAIKEKLKKNRLLSKP